MREQRLWAACGMLAVCLLIPAWPASAQAPTPAAPGPVRALSLDEAVQLALEHNLGLQVQRLNPQFDDVGISMAKAAWLPTIGGTLTTSKRSSPVNSFFSGADDKLENDSLSSEINASQLLPWGANYAVSWNTSRAESNSVFSSPNPSLGANIIVTFTQPLLKDFKTDSARQQLVVSKANREVADFELRQSVLVTVRNVKNSYWNHKAAINALAVAKQSLDLARESLRNNRTRVEVGTMAPIDVVEAEAEVARREESVIVAQGNVAATADRLRTLIFPTDMKDYWSVALDPTESAVKDRKPIDPDAAVRAALEKRTDLRAARKNLEVTGTTIEYYRNQSLPDVNAIVSYGQTGQGGTKKNFGSGFPPTVLGSVEEGYGTVLSRMLKPDYNNWSVGLQVTYPIGTSAAKANLARTKLQRSQAELQLRELELSVASSVREIARQVDTNWKRLEASGATRRLMERRLESEQKKFASGLSTNYMVFQAQRDLAEAQYSELVATLDYNRSLIDFETVQESPTAGGSSVTIQ